MDTMLDLDNLTDEERAVILNVLKRDERLKRSEDKKIIQLKKEIQNIRMKSVLRQGDDLSKICARCHRELGFLFNRGDICLKCRFRVCNICQETLLNGKWLCSLCFRQRQLQWLQGESGNGLSKWPSGADLVRASISRSLTIASGTESDPGVEQSPRSKRSNGSTVSNGSAHKDGGEMTRVTVPKDSDKRKLTQLFDSFKMQPKSVESTPEKRQMSVKRVTSRRYTSDTESSSSSDDDVSSSLPQSVMTNSVRSSPAPSTGDNEVVGAALEIHASDSVLNKSSSDVVHNSKKSLQRKHSYDSDQTIHSDDVPFSKSSTETQIRVEVHSDNSSTKSLESYRPKSSPSVSSKNSNQFKQSLEGATGARKNSSSSQRSTSPETVRHMPLSRQAQPGRSPSPYSFDSIPSSHANSPLPKQRLIDSSAEHAESSDTDSLSRFSNHELNNAETQVREGGSGVDEFAVEELSKVRFHKISKKGEKRSRSPHSPTRSNYPAAMEGLHAGMGRVGVEVGPQAPHTSSDTMTQIKTLQSYSTPIPQTIEDTSEPQLVRPKAPPRTKKKSVKASTTQEMEPANQRRLIPCLIATDPDGDDFISTSLRHQRRKEHVDSPIPGRKVDKLMVDEASLKRSKSDSSKYDVDKEKNLSIKDAKRLFEKKGKEHLFGGASSVSGADMETSMVDMDDSIMQQMRLPSIDPHCRPESVESFKLSPMTPLSPSKVDTKPGSYTLTFFNDSVFDSPDLPDGREQQQSSKVQQTDSKSKKSSKSHHFKKPKSPLLKIAPKEEMDDEFEDIFNKAMIDLKSEEGVSQSQKTPSISKQHQPLFSRGEDVDEIVELLSAEDVAGPSKFSEDQPGGYSIFSQEYSKEGNYHFSADDNQAERPQEQNLWHFEDDSIANDHKTSFGNIDNQFSHSRENVLSAFKAMGSEDSYSDLLSVIQEDTEPSEDGTGSQNSVLLAEEDAVQSFKDSDHGLCSEDDANTVISVSSLYDSSVCTQVQDLPEASESEQYAVSAKHSQDDDRRVKVDTQCHSNVTINVECYEESEVKSEGQSQQVTYVQPTTRGENTDINNSDTSAVTTPDSQVTMVMKEGAAEVCTDETETPEVMIRSKISSKKLVKQWLNNDMLASDSDSQQSFDMTPSVPQDHTHLNPALTHRDAHPTTDPADSPEKFRIPIHTFPDPDTEKDIPTKLSPRASSEGSASLEDSGHVSGSSTQDNTPEHRRTDSTQSTQSQLSVPSTLSTVNDKDEESEADIDELVATHKASASYGSSYGNLLSTVADSRESIASFYSNAGEVDYGKIPVTGEIQFGIEYNYRTGTLEISIRQCKDLAPVDTRRNRSDPYVKTYLLPDKTRGGKRKTKVRKSTLSPVFDETLRYLISKSEVENRNLWVTVWHNDRFGRNDFLGEVNINFDYFRFTDSSPKWYPLQERIETPTTSLLTYRGDLVISIKYVPPEKVSDSSTSPSKKKGKRGKIETGKGQLHVLIKEARNLTAVRSNGFSDPFLKGYLLPDKHRGSKQKTSVMRKECNPKWNCTFIFDDVSVEDLRERSIELTIWDHDKISSNDFLGGVRLNTGIGRSFGRLVDWMDSKGEEISMWQAMLDRVDCWIDGTLILRPNMDKRKY